MWLCPKCHYKNQNTNRLCHGIKCKTPKPDKIIQQEQAQAAKVLVRDLCPRCKSHQDFKKVNKAWSCTNCHAKCRKRGKPIPENKSP